MPNKLIESLQIKSLQEIPEFIPTLAQWTYTAWGKYDPTLNIETTIKHLQARMGNLDTIPITFVALHNNLPIATVTLKEKIVVPGYEDRDLWLGSFIVQEEHQNQGVGTFLLDYAFAMAKDLGYSKISLFASDPKAAEWYAKHGWKMFATDTYQGHPVTLLEHIL